MPLKVVVTVNEGAGVMLSRCPNFLFIGPDKAGSTWLYRALKEHHQVYLSYAKELFFFDRFYDRGWRWYMRFFKGAKEQHRVVGEISHDYLFSRFACERIVQDLPSPKLMVCLREPSQRAFSSYLYMIKQGRVAEDFDTALREIDELIDHGCYAKYLSRYLKHFRRDQIYVAVFDDLVADPQRFFNGICDFLSIERVQLSAELRGNALPSARPRSQFLAGVARRIGWQVRRCGMPGVVGRIKQSVLFNRILYSSYGHGDKPEMSPAARDYLREVFTVEVQRLEVLLGADFCNRWGYPADKGCVRSD